MEIIEFDRNLSSYEVLEDVRKRKLHLVFIAVQGLTFYGTFSGVLGIDARTAWESVVTVNEKNEVGTHFPKANLTIIPLS